LASTLGPQFAGGALAALPAATGTAIAATSTARAVAAAATAAALAPQITPSPTLQAATCTDRAILAADVTYPDGAAVPGGGSFLKTWRLRNTGTCTWSTAYALVFVRGEQMGGAAAVPFAAEAKPGESADLSVNLTAPDNRGTYRGYWQLRNAAGKNFGIGGPGDGSFWVEIAVTSPASAALPPATATATPVPTPTGVPTLAPTLEAPPTPPQGLTPAPTLAPTQVPGATPEPTGPEHVVFPAGATSVTLTLDLSADGAKVFVLGAKAGQRLTIDATQSGLLLDVVGPNGASLASADGSTTGNWTFRLPLAGDYVVLLQGIGLGQITFTLP
jgi:Ig-like domain from next to BRCA1 gene